MYNELVKERYCQILQSRLLKHAKNGAKMVQNVDLVVANERQVKTARPVSAKNQLCTTTGPKLVLFF